MLGSKFTCQVEKTLYLLHFYKSLSFSVILHALPCNLPAFKHMVTMTSPLGDATELPSQVAAPSQGHVN